MVRGPGRRTLENQEAVLVAIRDGATDADAAARVGLQPRTIDAWRFRHPEFREQHDAA
jgi:hypothetical protein